MKTQLQQMTEAEMDAFLALLDPGIRPEVRTLIDAGVETFESCQGGQGHCYPEPTIRFSGSQAEGFRAFGIARTYGLCVTALRRVWDVEDGELVGPKWEMTFGGPDRNPHFVEREDGTHTWEWR